MTITAPSAQPLSTPHDPVPSTRFDFIATAVAGWFIFGIYADGWAHNHIPQLETFFTLGHGILYTAVVLVIGIVGGLRWPIHMWAGVAFVAGIISLILSFLVVPPLL
jgi:hypothetical protein